MGKALSEFRRVTGGLQAEVRDAMSQLENEVNAVIPEAPRPPQPPQPPSQTQALPPVPPSETE